MVTPVFGTAHLFGATDDPTSAGLLDAAWDAGFRAFDTAPLYGHGRSEAELGLRLRRWSPRPQLTSKVGLEPAPPPTRATRLAKAAARRLPPTVQQRLRPGDGAPHGDFAPDLVRRSVERSLQRLGRLDRLLLHEVHPDDLTDELLTLLTGLRDAGDVGQVGVATANALAGPSARRAPDLLTVAHVEVGPFAASPDLPASVTTVVGHGVLGPGGDALRRLGARLERDPAPWDAVTRGTTWAGPTGLAEALVARTASLPLTDVIVATSRPARLPRLHELVAGSAAPPADVAAVLERWIAAGRGSAG